MALPVYAHGMAGQIFIEDEDEDGTIILLVCEEADPDDPTGIPAVPEKKEPSDRRGPVWPTLEYMIQRAEGPEAAIRVAPQPFSLHVVTTQLPAGVLPFNHREFLSRAREVAESGEDWTEITMANADEWGFRGQLQARAY